MAYPRIPGASLFVGDLHPDVTETYLRERFHTYGNILSIRVCRDVRKSLGYAFVNYQSRKEAKRAMDNLNFEDIYGHPCRIRWDQKDPAARKSGGGNIFIKNLDISINFNKIDNTFANFGEISSCKLQIDENGVSKGVAFVNFNEEADAEKPVRAIDGKMIEDKFGNVAKFIPRSERDAHNKDFTECFIKNFGTHLTDNSLRELFERFGEIVSARVILNKENNTSKGFGFVRFSAPDEAARAISEMDGEIVEGNTLHVELARKKEDRVARLPSQLVNKRQPVFNPGNMNPQRPFMERPGNNLQSRGPQPSNSRMPANQSKRGGIQQNPQRRNISVDGRQGDNMMYQYPLQDTQAVRCADQMKMSGLDLAATYKIASSDSMDTKQSLGEIIYPLVRKHAGDMAGKITGNSLQMKIEEALSGLNIYKGGDGEIQNVRQNSYTRSIAGNQTKPQLSTIATGRRGVDTPRFPGA